MLVVADLDRALAFYSETLTTRPWGQRTAYVRDPDGNLVELVQDLAARR